MKGITLNSWEGRTGVLKIFSRDPENGVLFETDQLDYATGHALVKLCDSLYKQGVEHGRAQVAEKVRAAVSEEVSR